MGWLARADAAGLQIQRQIRHGFFQRLGARRPAQQRADARDQFGKGEGLDQIIVRPAFQAEDAVLDGIAGRQEQDGCFSAAGAERLENFDAAVAGQHPVEHDQIKRFCVEEEEPLLAGVGGGDGEAGALQPGGESAGRFQVVLDNEQAHKH